jgi:hypothetical protein
MFRYINMPKLVATYLREFSCDAEGKPSALYKFIFCLCLPFVSATFRRARLNALAIAECTNSGDQIARVLQAITGAEMTYVGGTEDYEVSYDAVGQTMLSFDDTFNEPVVSYGDPRNMVVATIRLNGASRQDVESYLTLLVPFYVNLLITNWE